METLANKIRLVRLAKGLSQENMADMLGISTTAYGDIERNKTDLTIKRLAQIANIFETSVHDLLEQNHNTQLNQLELKKLRAENEKLYLENQYLREKLAGRVILDWVKQQPTAEVERRKIGF